VTTAAVVGGGPAGLMAAEVLATAGVSVTVHERMPSVGRKLLLAGRGGLNLTHSEPLEVFLDRYGPARPRLESAITAFDPTALRAWCEGLGQAPFVGTSGRVFPSGFRATPLLRAWLARLDALGVERRVRHEWTGFDDPSVQGDVLVLALGGASWPRTGSNGAWVDAVRRSGVDVRPLRPANCGFAVAWSDVLRQRFAGAPLKDVRLSFRGESARGDAIVSEAGLEGGPVYALSAALRDAIERDGSSVTLTVDLRPEQHVDDILARVRRARRGDSLANVLRRVGLAPVGIALVREVLGAERPRPDELARLIKALPVVLCSPLPLERAISTAGGIALDEIDDTFMLRARPGTFVAGEMLDWEAPTGGYLLQATFSTAVAAADGALAWLASTRS